jgi:hypothetical protein
VSIVDALKDLIQLLLDVEFSLANAANPSSAILAIDRYREREALLNAFSTPPMSTKVAHFNLSLLLIASTCGYVLPTAEAIGHIYRHHALQPLL